MKKRWNAKRKPEVIRSKGDLVWVDAAHYKISQPSRKLLAKRLGPFPIIQKVEKSVYELKISLIWKSIHLVINKSYLTSYTSPTFEQQSQKSNNQVMNPIDPTNVQEVEEILNLR